jgi:hypothetical protein
VLLFRRLRVASQALTEDTEGFRDRVLCTRGREVWFDCDAIIRSSGLANWTSESLPLTLASGRRWHETARR